MMENQDVRALLDRTTLKDFINSTSAYRRGKKSGVIVLDRTATLGEAIKVRKGCISNLYMH